MAIFVELQNTLVINAIVLDEQSVDNLEFPDSEPIGQAFIASVGLTGDWLQTSPEGLYRGCYAGIGYTYDASIGEYGEFIEPPPVEA